MARASSRNMSSTLRPLRSMWDGNGRLSRGTGFSREEDDGIRVPEHHLGQLSPQARQRASSGATTRMNSSPSTTRPGTQSPSQPQRDLPGVRNFSLFGGVYTWKKSQEDADLNDPNLNGGAGKGGLRGYVAPAGKPAAGESDGREELKRYSMGGDYSTPAGRAPVARPATASSDASYASMFAGANKTGAEDRADALTGERVSSALSELRSMDAGDGSLFSAGEGASGRLARTGDESWFIPGVTGKGILTSAASAGGLHGQTALPSQPGDRFYVPAGTGEWTGKGELVDMGNGITYRRPPVPGSDDPGSWKNVQKGMASIARGEALAEERMSAAFQKIEGLDESKPLPPEFVGRKVEQFRTLPPVVYGKRTRGSLNPRELDPI